MTRQLLISTVLLLWMGCRKPAPKELYGDYQYYYDLCSSRITFYPDNIYSYHYSSLLNSSQDSGTFVYDLDTIYLTSIKSVEHETHTNSITLTDVKLIYQNGRLYSVSSFGTITYTKISKPKISNLK